MQTNGLFQWSFWSIKGISPFSFEWNIFFKWYLYKLANLLKDLALRAFWVEDFVKGKLVFVVSFSVCCQTTLKQMNWFTLYKTVLIIWNNAKQQIYIYKGLPSVTGDKSQNNGTPTCIMVSWKNKTLTVWDTAMFYLQYLLTINN